MTATRRAASPLEPRAQGPIEHLHGPVASVPPGFIERVVNEGIPIAQDIEARTETARDWWPLAIAWAARGEVPRLPALVARPIDVDQVVSLLRLCNEALVPITPTAGASGVCGGSIPLFGGVSLDMTGLAGVQTIDDTSLIADVSAGTFGPDLEAALGAFGTGYTLGHWPQSMAISTVGGWIACRGAGQYSTRYGKIEDLVEGLEVVLADGTVIRTDGAAPRAAVGPNLTQLFLGSEGTLGVVTAARLRITPAPPVQARRAVAFARFEDGLEVCRRILGRGATPAVLRLYDSTESQRHFDIDSCVLVLLDEADPVVLDATMAICDQESASGERLDDELVERWLRERNDTSALGPLWKANIVVDTMEVAGHWSSLAPLANDVVRTMEAIEGTLAASVHESHAYPQGACLYFTFAGRRPGATEDDEAELSWQQNYYRRVWDAATSCVLEHGGAISHHHGIGLNRGRFMSSALGSANRALALLKRSFDPAGILNPGKLGFDSVFGPSPWP